MAWRERAVAGALAAMAAGLAQGAQVQWALFDPDCVDGLAAIEVPCGDYGVFHLVTFQGGTCEPIDDGDEQPAVYAAPPVSSSPPVLPAPEPERASTGGREPARAVTAPGTLPPPPPPPEVTNPWIAVLDFSGAHGDSTKGLAAGIAGPGVTTELRILDDPALAALGEEVGDLHVLAQLCRIAEQVDHEGRAAPLVINMSFGRAARSEDPTSAACTGDQASCQVARVLAHLRDRRVALVAAAGNHQETLFPASLQDVLAAGMLDVDRFLLDRMPLPAWETPGGVDAWIPGNALCIGSYAAPAGSSYSSALLAGWLARLLRQQPSTDLFAGLWFPLWHVQRQCFVLAREALTTPWCNDAVTKVFDGLAGDYETSCWSVGSQPSILVSEPAAAAAVPLVPNEDEFLEQEHPAPEADPCVPCVGHVTNTHTNPALAIDVSQSSGLAPGVYLDSLSLRVGNSFYPLTLSAQQLADFAAGTLSELVLDGAAWLIQPGQQASLWYLLKNSLTASCTGTSPCYWSSTPLLMK